MKIIVMIKPTDACNLRCKYCYHAEYSYSPEIMKEEMFASFIEKTIKDYDHIHFIWHGGEPLLAGLEFYRNVVAIEKKYIEKYNICITNAIQTNATLLYDQYTDFLLDHDFHIGISFDGMSNERMRGLSDKTLESIEYLQKRNVVVSAIKVLINEELEDITDVYNYYNRKKMDVKISALFDCKLVSENKLIYSSEEYISAMIELFMFWVNDEQCRIRVEPFESYLSLIVGNIRRECSHGSCMTKFISINHDGDIYPCSRYFPKEYKIGNIDRISHIKEIFESVEFTNLLKLSIERRKQCITQCDLFPYCQGGCNHDALVEGDISKNGFFSCKVFKALFTYIRYYINDIDTSTLKNERARKIAEQEKR